MDIDDPERLPETVRHRGACGKARYASQHAAKAGLRRLQQRGRDRSFEGRLHAYPCGACHGWHVGHTRFEGPERDV